MADALMLDTDVMVDFLRGHPRAIALVKGYSGTIILPSIVIAELYAGVQGDQELAAMDDFVALCRVVPITRELARAGGIHKRDYTKSHNIGLADAIVAATAQSEKADLKTLNVKHYPMLIGLKPAYIKR